MEGSLINEFQINIWKLSYKIILQSFLYKLSNKQRILINFFPLFMMNHIQMLKTIIFNELILHLLCLSNLLGSIKITINVIIWSIQIDNYWIQKSLLRRNSLKYFRLFDIFPLLFCYILSFYYIRILYIDI